MKLLFLPRLRAGHTRWAAATLVIGLLAGFTSPADAREGPFDPERIANTVILDSQGVENLGIETVPVSEASFEDSFFAVGRIVENPKNHAVLSSRIPGRIVDLKTFTGDLVKQNDELVQVESRLSGDPPPRIWLVAPIGGLIMKSHVRLGEPVEPAKELLDILDLTEVWASARVPEDLAAKLEPGKTMAYIRIAALGKEAIAGTLLRFGTFADQENGTMEAIFQIPNPDLRIRPGMRATFRVITDVREKVMAVPREAIQGDPAGRVVYVRGFDLPHAFVKIPVKVGSQNENLVEVTGLRPEDEVVTTGSYPLGFAGKGIGLSVKEALDIDHGHAHNEDGSEMTAEEKAAEDEAAREAAREEAAAGESFGLNPLTLFLAIACAVLFVLLILSLSRRRPGRAPKPAAT